jgi:hypothetical protein
VAETWTETLSGGGTALAQKAVRRMLRIHQQPELCRATVLTHIH